jgi:hypothetical protein
MLDLLHRFYCIYCRMYLGGEDAEKLTATVNSHFQAKHPLNYDNWSAKTIACSIHYVAPEAPETEVRSEYTVPNGTSKKKLEEEYDRKWLGS